MRFFKMVNLMVCPRSVGINLCTNIAFEAAVFIIRGQTHTLSKQLIISLKYRGKLTQKLNSIYGLTWG